MYEHESRFRRADGGLSAVEAALDFRPGVALLDIGLQGIAGFEVAKRLRQTPDLKDTVLVAMTGYGQEAEKLRSHDAGFNHHLVKPADFDKVKRDLGDRLRENDLIRLSLSCRMTERTTDQKARFE